jgi:hypothetical protein
MDAGSTRTPWHTHGILIGFPWKILALEAAMLSSIITMLTIWYFNIAIENHRV